LQSNWIPGRVDAVKVKFDFSKVIWVQKQSRSGLKQGILAIRKMKEA